MLDEALDMGAPRQGGCAVLSLVSGVTKHSGDHRMYLDTRGEFAVEGEAVC